MCPLRLRWGHELSVRAVLPEVEATDRLAVVGIGGTAVAAPRTGATDVLVLQPAASRKQRMSGLLDTFKERYTVVVSSKQARAAQATQK